MKTMPTLEEVRELGINLQMHIDGGRYLDYDNNGHLWAMTNKAHGILTHRYSVDGVKFTINTYGDSVTTTGKEDVGCEPEWLKRILDVAYLGGHGLALKTTPPDFVVWFETDKDLHLLRFIIETEEPEAEGV
jgi:hypothetical protein